MIREFLGETGNFPGTPLLNKQRNDFMNLKYKINKFFGGISLALISAGVLSSCTDELKLGDGVVELGDRVEGVLSVPISLPAADKMTRSTDFSAGATVKVDSYWVGAFDTYTGELLGYKLDTAPRKDDGSRNTIKNTTGVFTVSDMEIYYYQKHPEAYVVSVVNLNEVKAKKAGSGDQLYDLKDLLENARTWDDFCAIAIDTESAAAANPDEADGIGKMPLMMGYYTTGNPKIHPTVNPENNNAVNINNVKATFSEGGNGKVNLTDGSVKLMRLLSEVTVHVGGPEINMEMMKKLLELYPELNDRPMYLPSGENFPDIPRDPENYNPDNTSPPFPGALAGFDVKVSNIKYKVCNNPKSVYLAEHATDMKAASRSADDFLKFTANSADHDGENGYSDSGDWINVDGNTFTYQYYENKHWGDLAWLDKFIDEEMHLPPLYNPPGYPELTDEQIKKFRRMQLLMSYPYFAREKKHSMQGFTFSSLSPSDGNTQNNNAPYFIIKADVTISYPYEDYMTENIKYSGTVEYVIHEGFTSSANGEGVNSQILQMMINGPSYNDPAKMAEEEIKMADLYNKMGEDYQRTRNTQYDYYISILGVNQLWINVNNHSWGDYVADKLNWDGVSGEMKILEPIELDGEGSLEDWHGTKYATVEMDINILEDFYRERNEIRWRYVINTPEGQQNYGKWDAEEDWAHGVAPVNSPIVPTISSQFKDNIKFLLIDHSDSYNTPYPNADSEGIISGSLVKEWSLDEFFNSIEEIDPSYFDPEKYHMGIYVSKLETDVPFAQIDQVYRDLYLKVPEVVGEDGKSKFVMYYTIQQKPSDIRVDLTDYDNYYQYFPELGFRCNHHHASDISPSEYYRHEIYTGSAGLVTYICWDADVYSRYLGIQPEYWELEIQGQEIIKVNTNDSRYNIGDGLIHYPYSIPTNLVADEALAIKIKPVNFLNVSDNSPAAFKASVPYLYEYAFYVYPLAGWNFNVWQQNVYNPSFEFTYYYYEDNPTPVTCFGLTLNPEMKPHFYPTASEEKNKSYGYIQTAGSGNMSKKSFTVDIDRPGTFKVEASWTGTTPPSDDRYIMLYNSKLNRVVDEKLVTNKSDEYGVFYELRATDMTAGEPIKMGIFGSNNLRIYSIEFIPD